ncbi:carbohydrate ABC transporter permease [Candidatus Aerophobetes bacterium]|nr:carbohydrate ABC transporter permease [Candidatus Aerophobetes bacterium]
MKKRTGKEIINYTISYFIIFILLVYILIPFYWMGITSLKRTQDVYSYPIKYIPDPITFRHYIRIWHGSPFLRYFLNSVIVAGCTTILSLFISTFAGYSFSRFRYKMRKTLLVYILINQMIPAILIVIPIFLIIKTLRLLNTYISLILVYTAFTIPFCTWMLKNYFDTLPKEIEEAAKVDGCTYLQILWKIVVPVSAPGFVAAGMFSFIVAWHEFVVALTLISKEEMMTLPVGLYSFVTEFTTEWELISAGCIIATIPIAVMFVILQRYFVQGLTKGAIKT